MIIKYWRRGEVVNIPKDKEELIYEVSLKEFAEKGYELASTNNIVK
ncbi:hypothetical protein GNF83_16590, partial [Clostridium perfringens]|nr:hypothetical protein [Clostridium perfringens]